ncbi:MAG TPA: hypothetical protein VNW06_11310 [Cytophagaceae bacterium]|jgi:hypothetical protein|nr:hypothetical protein [Cytophagaceae bacterium]
MYSTEEGKEILQGKKLINGECWMAIRKPGLEKVRTLIKEKEALSIQQIVDMVRINDEDIEKIENVNLKIINNNITEKDACKQKTKLRKDIIQIFVKHKKEQIGST